MPEPACKGGAAGASIPRDRDDFLPVRGSAPRFFGDVGVGGASGPSCDHRFGRCCLERGDGSVSVGLELLARSKYTSRACSRPTSLTPASLLRSREPTRGK